MSARYFALIALFSVISLSGPAATRFAYGDDQASGARRENNDAFPATEPASGTAPSAPSAPVAVAKPKAHKANRVIASNVMPEFFPESPESEHSRDEERMKTAFVSPDDPALENIPDVGFCSEWNPEFSFNGQRCCRSLTTVHTRKNRQSCFVRHHGGGFCSEMTDEQREYQKTVASGKAGDVLDLITHDMGRTDQAYCTVNNGFLAHGRPVVPSERNHIVFRDPSRCTQFGTDQMVGMIEWLGRQVGQHYSGREYSKVHLLLGDVAAPRGGCLAGSSGWIGHLSHTNGTDADIGLLNARANRSSPSGFTNDFDADSNWWMIKQILKNPYACVKVIFLDKHHIKKLSKFAWRDPDWVEYRRFIRHIKGHRNHMHVRVGDHPGPPGCGPGAHPEDELDPGSEEESDPSFSGQVAESSQAD